MHHDGSPELQPGDHYFVVRTERINIHRQRATVRKHLMQKRVMTQARVLQPADGWMTTGIWIDMPTRPTLRRHLGMSRMADLAARIMVCRSSAASRARPSGRPASKGRCTASCIQS